MLRALEGLRVFQIGYRIRAFDDGGGLWNRGVVAYATESLEMSVSATKT